MDEISPLVIVEDTSVYNPPRLIGRVLSFTLFVGGVGQLVFLPLFLRSFGEDDSDPNPAHFVLMSNGILSVIVTGIFLGTSYVFQKRAWTLLSLRENWKYFIGSGVLCGIGRVILVYVSFPHRTAPVLQAIFSGVSGVFSVLSFKLLFASSAIRCIAVIPICGILITLAGCGLGLYEGIDMVTQGTSILDESLWQILFICSFLFFTFSQTIQWLFWYNKLRESFIKTDYWQMLNMLFWVQLSELLTYLAFFWVDILPTFGYAESAEMFFSNFGRTITLFFKTPNSDTVIFGCNYAIALILYNLSYIGLSHPYHAIPKVIAEIFILPVSAALWIFVPPLQIALTPTMWIVYVSLCLVLIGQIFMKYWQCDAYQKLFSENESLLEEESEVTSSKINPSGTASLLSQYTFSWVSSLVYLGFKRPLEDKDIWKPAYPDRADVVGHNLEKAWEEELLKPKPSVGRAFFASFGSLLLLPFTMFAIHLTASIIGPAILMRDLLSFLESNNDNTTVGWILVFGVFFTQLVASSTIQYSFMAVTEMGVRVKQAMMYLIFRKTLKLVQISSTGEIVNLSSNDSTRLFMLCRTSQLGWAAIALILAGGGLLIADMGWAGVVGFFSLCLLVPFQVVISKKIALVRRSTVKVTDERVRTMSDILSAVQLIKFCTWEDSFTDKVKKQREEEVRWLRIGKVLKSINDSTSLIGTVITTFLTLITHVLLGNELKASTAFTAITLLNIMRVSLQRVPMFSKTFGEVFVTFARLQAFLTRRDISDTRDVKPKTDKARVQIIQGDFSVNSSEDDAKKDESGVKEGFILKDINLEASAGMLIAIVGSVGSGKSSLLNAILGQISKINGEVKIEGSIAFASQQPWLVNASLKENILFGTPYNEKRYNKVITCCELLPDIKQLPAGDLTEIGERGINLSGGQKQRVSLARAAYTNKDIYLLDDTLSAVDRHVGNRLFNNCINGILRPKLILFVTNQLQYLAQCDHVIFLQDGRIDGAGTFTHLQQTNKTFKKLIKKYSANSEEKENKLDQPDATTAPAKKIDTTGRSEKGTLITQETRVIGNVGIETYLQYAKSGGYGLAFLVLILSILTGLAQVFSSWFVSYWIENVESESTGFFVGIYALIIILYILVTFGRGFAFAIACLKSSTKIHNSVFKVIMHAPMNYFFTTPTGRILNKFSSDQDKIDEVLPDLMYPAIHFSINSFCTLGVIIGVLPWFALTAVPMFIIFIWLIRYFMASSRELRRLEAISVSPIFAHLSATLKGLATIRAYGAAQRFEEEYIAKLERHHATLFVAESVGRWVGLRLDTIGTAVVAVTAFLIMLLRDQVSPAVAGLALSYSFQMTGAFQFAVRSFAETDSLMTSVERLLGCLSETPQEAATIIENNRPHNWPQQGDIAFKNVYMKYETSETPVLHDLTFHIQSKEKIGIVGRTGAGKSSITLALFRLIEIHQGTIEIDGIDISKLGLKDLRKNLAIIPQDPVLFLGTVKTNLDPWGDFNDMQIFEALKKVRMEEVIQELPQRLETRVEEGGTNFSLGQRQLICIARALLQSAKILVLDEATASIDIETDNLIQRTIKERFQDCTVLTIAHRLHTIIDSDRIMVLDKGTLAELDTPHNLLNNPHSLFSGLVNETDDADKLRSLAAANARV